MSLLFGVSVALVDWFGRRVHDHRRSPEQSGCLNVAMHSEGSHVEILYRNYFMPNLY